MVLSHKERTKKFWKSNRATGSERSQAKNVEAASKVYQAVVPEELQYTEEQWLNNQYQAMASILDNGPQDEEDLAKVLHKRNPETGLTGQKWRCTLPPASKSEPDWFDKARAARAVVRAHVKANLDEIMKTLVEVDSKNVDVLFFLDDVELEKHEKVLIPKKSPDKSDEDSGDAVKENIGAARASTHAAAKPSKLKPVAKKRAAASESEEDDEFQLEAPKAKRQYMRKAAPKEIDAEKDEDYNFFDAVKKARCIFEDQARVDKMRELISLLGLLEPDETALARRKLIGQFAKDLAGGDDKKLAEQFFNVLCDDARNKGLKLHKRTRKPVVGDAMPAAEEPDATAEEPEAVAA